MRNIIIINNNTFKMPKRYKLVNNKPIGEGDDCLVFKIKNKQGYIFAMKVFKKKFDKEKIRQNRAKKQLEIINYFNDTLFEKQIIAKIKYLKTLKGEKVTVLILTYLNGGTLTNTISKKKFYGTEKEEAFKRLLNKLIKLKRIYGDLKPGNILWCKDTNEWLWIDTSFSYTDFKTSHEEDIKRHILDTFKYVVRGKEKIKNDKETKKGVKQLKNVIESIEI